MMIVLVAFIAGVLLATGIEVYRLVAETRRSAAALEGIEFELRRRNDRDYGKQ